METYQPTAVVFDDGGSQCPRPRSPSLLASRSRYPGRHDPLSSVIHVEPSVIHVEPSVIQGSSVTVCYNIVFSAPLLADRSGKLPRYRGCLRIPVPRSRQDTNRIDLSNDNNGGAIDNTQEIAASPRSPVSRVGGRQAIIELVAVMSTLDVGGRRRQAGTCESPSPARDRGDGSLLIPIPSAAAPIAWAQTKPAQCRNHQPDALAFQYEDAL